MKKHILLVAMMMFFCLLLGCEKKQESNVVKKEKQQKPLVCTEIEAVDLSKSTAVTSFELKHKDANILYFDDEYLVYTVGKTNMKNVDTSNESIYVRNQKTQKTKKVLEVEYWNTSSGDVAVHNGKVYYQIFCLEETGEKNYLLEVDMKKAQGKRYEIASSNVPLVFLTTTDAGVYTLGVNDENSTQTYHRVELWNKGKSSVVAQTIYPSETNEYIGAMCGEGEYLYLYGEGEDKSYLTKLNGDGETLNPYEIDLNEFLKIPSIVEDSNEYERDTVWNFVKKGDYYILTTLNHRVCIFYEVDGQLKEIEVPEVFQDFEEGVALMNEHEAGRYVFFKEVIKKRWYIFDSSTGEFHYCDIKGKGTIKEFNGDNQILFSVEKKNGKEKYICYEREDWKK